MRKLQDIDLEEYYADEFKSCKGHYNRSIDVLLERLKEEENIIDLKNELLSIIQLYLDGLLSNASKKDANNNGIFKQDDQADALNNLILASKETIGGFYWGVSVDINEVKDLVLQCYETIRDSAAHEWAKRRHLVNKEIELYEFGLELQKKMGCEIEAPDTIVCIATGGFEPAQILMNLIDETGDLAMAMVRYSIRRRQDSDVQTFENILPQMPSLSSKLNGKRIWIVDDIIASGETMSKVITYVVNLGAFEIYGMSVEGKLDRPLKEQNIRTLNRQNPFICEYFVPN